MTVLQVNVHMHDEYVVVVLAGKHMPMLSGLFHFILCLRSPHIVRLYLNQLASCHFVWQPVDALKPIVFICHDMPPAAFVSFMV